MNASILDLRYKTREILTALENRERITILYHGKPRGTIIPLEDGCKGQIRRHPFFGMDSQETEPVDMVMAHLRSSRHAL